MSSACAFGVCWKGQLGGPAAKCKDGCERAATGPRSDGLGEWHTQPPGWTWRLRDRFARTLGFHCWDCMVKR